LAVNGSVTFSKKDGRSSHRLNSNKGRAYSTCQHTCGRLERCAHAGRCATGSAVSRPRDGRKGDDLVITAVRTGEHPHRGLSLLVIERDTPGFARGRNLDKSGLHAQDTAELSFTDVRGPAANRRGPEGAGFFGLTANLPCERVSTAVAALAQAAAAVEAAMGYVRERTAFGQPELGVLLGAERLGRVLDTCVQLHGGYGYMRDYPVARAWASADSRVSRIYGGTTEIMKEIIGRSLQLG
jgi:alkylation response protein AidB-like acyl-CoA dehydrogenase